MVHDFEVSILVTSPELRVLRDAGGVHPNCPQAKAGGSTLDTSSSQDYAHIYCHFVVLMLPLVDG